MKKLFSILLVLVMVLTLVPMVFASEEAVIDEEEIVLDEPIEEPAEEVTEEPAEEAVEEPAADVPAEEEPETDGSSALVDNLAATFSGFAIDNISVLSSGTTSGTGSGGGTWEVSVYNINSTGSVVFITLNDYVGENIKITARDSSRLVHVIANGDCDIIGHTRAWPGIYYESSVGATLQVTTNGRLTIHDTDIGIAVGNTSYGAASSESIHEAYLILRGSGYLNIDAGSRGLHALSGISSGWSADNWFGDISIASTHVSITCTRGYGAIVTGGVRKGDQWTAKGLSVRGGATLKIQTPDGTPALEQQGNYELGEGYVEEGSDQDSYWFVKPSGYEEPHTVTFITDYGTAPAAQTVKHGSIVAKPADPVDPSGEHVFRFWATRRTRFVDGISRIVYNTFDFDTAVTSDLTLYARWEAAPTTPGTEELTVIIASDCKSAKVTGDWTGLYARVALVLDNNGVSGLYITQATINDDGTILIPEFIVPGLKVKGVNVSLVPTLADIQSSTPKVEATATKMLGT